jgi:hypothetical protein
MAPWVALSPDERAGNIKRRILDFAKQRETPGSTVHIEDRGPWTEILAGDKPIMDVSEYDCLGMRAVPEVTSPPNTRRSFDAPSRHTAKFIVGTT